MNSLELYQEILHTSWDEREDLRAGHVEKLVRCILAELHTPPFLVKNSPFLSACAQERITIVDAWFTVSAVVSCLRDPSYHPGHSRHVMYLFRGVRVRNEDTLRHETRRLLRTIKFLLPRQPEEIRTETEETPVSVYEKERLRHAEARMAHNLALSKARQKEDASLLQSVYALEPAVMKLTKEFESLRTSIQSESEMRFIQILIHQYHQIADALEYHMAKASVSDNEDYYNAVLNYDDFLCDIADALALFGVEEIISDPGTPFDGSIHSVRGTKEFSPRHTIVRKSLRSGFRRGEAVLEKERILTEVDHASRN